MFVFALGPAGGGKSTFVEMLRRTYGDYAVSADFSTFLTTRPSDGPREDVARLAGARLVTSVETRDGGALAAGILKLLTGGDTIAARRLYEQSFEFVPQFKLLLAANARPRAAADDDGLWRRLRELPFPCARPTAAERDDTIKTTLLDPAGAGAAVLAWAVEGCATWFTEGLGEPSAVTAASEAYRRSQDDVAAFVEECCRLGPHFEITATALRAEYEQWGKARGLKHLTEGAPWGAALRALGCTSIRTRAAGRCWAGIDLRPPDDPGEPAETVEPGAREPW